MESRARSLSLWLGQPAETAAPARVMEQPRAADRQRGWRQDVGSFSFLLNGPLPGYRQGAHSLLRELRPWHFHQPLQRVLRSMCGGLAGVDGAVAGDDDALGIPILDETQ